MSQAVMLVLAATLLVAALAKLRAPGPFAAVLATLVGPRHVRPLSFAVVLGELTLAVALLSGTHGRAVALVTLAVLAGFSAALLALRKSATDIPSCNCFGARSGDPADGLARNAALAALAVALVIAPVGEPAWSVALEDLVAAATVAVGAACCWQLARTLRLISGSSLR